MKLLIRTLIFISLAGTLNLTAAAQRNKTLDARVQAAIRQATAFMLDEVSCNGGFVWDYLPDLSRRWGEMEAYPTMAWTQGAGTPAMGEFFLDLYHATGDEYYYQAAEKVASALIRGQHPSGGWNYCFDFAGESSLQRWYNTIGKNGWRLEEFQHYYGNATYDDGATASPGRFLLRMYSEKNDPKFRPSVDKTVRFLLDSQYPVGGWPQRYPLMYEFSKNGKPDYTSYITFNDGAHKNNVELLILYYRVLGDKSLVDPILRAMNCVLTLQQGMPQPGWGDQFSLDYKPNHARSYEPRSINTRQTYHACDNLMDYYQITGETKFLSRIPEAIAWLESVRLPEADVERHGGPKVTPDAMVCPMYIEIGTNRGMYSHKEGSNVANGRYVIDYELPGKLAFLKMERLRKRYDELVAMPVGKATAGSPFHTYARAYRFPDYVVMRPDRYKPADREVEELLAGLVGGKYWLAPIAATSNPYIGDGSMTVEPGRTQGPVGDRYDTSPFPPDPPVMGITTKSYMENVSRLMGYLLRK